MTTCPAQPPDDDFRPWEQPGQFRRDCASHRVALLTPLALTAVLAAALTFYCVVLAAVGVPLGLPARAGLTLCCLVPALVSVLLGLTVREMARHDLAKMKAGLMDPRGRGATGDARACAAFAILCGAALLLVSPIIFLGRLLFEAAG